MTPMRQNWLHSMQTEQADLQKVQDTLIRVSQQLARIEQRLNQLFSTPPDGISVIKISSTIPGSDGRVIPGPMILEHKQASEFFAQLGDATVLPLNALPPWTHMALARGSWWLIQMA